MDAKDKLDKERADFDEVIKQFIRLEDMKKQIKEGIHEFEKMWYKDNDKDPTVEELSEIIKTFKLSEITENHLCERDGCRKEFKCLHREYLNGSPTRWCGCLQSIISSSSEANLSRLAFYCSFHCFDLDFPETGSDEDSVDH